MKINSLQLGTLKLISKSYLPKQIFSHIYYLYSHKETFYVRVWKSNKKKELFNTRPAVCIEARYANCHWPWHCLRSMKHIRCIEKDLVQREPWFNINALINGTLSGSWNYILPSLDGDPDWSVDWVEGTPLFKNNFFKLTKNPNVSDTLKETFKR